MFQDTASIGRVIIASVILALVIGFQIVADKSNQSDSGTSGESATPMSEYFSGRRAVVFSEPPPTSDSLRTLNKLTPVLAYPDSVGSSTDDFVAIYSERDSSRLGFVKSSSLWEDPHHPRSQWYTWQTVNIRSGPSTDYRVIAQENPNSPVWAAPNDSSDWALVFAGPEVADTAGYVHKSLIHTQERSPAQRRAKERKAKLEARRTTAREFERNLLEQGMDVHVDLTGPDEKTLRIEWVLAGRPEAYNLANDNELMSRLRLMNFERLVVTDGYGDSWAWDIQ